MDRLKRWFGGGAGDLQTELDSGRKQQKHGQLVQELEEGRLRRRELGREETQPVHQRETTPLALQTSLPDKAKVTESRVGQLQEALRNQVLKVVPLQPHDCLSCKLIGTTVPLAAIGYLLYHYRRSKLQFTGLKKTYYAVYIGTVVSGLLLLSGCRWYDLSFFAPPDADGHRKSLQELLQGDVDSLKAAYKQTFPSDTKQSKDDS